MANLAKLEFVALDIIENNYLSWTLDVEIHFSTMALAETIVEPNECSAQEKAKAIIFIYHHLREYLKMEYLTVNDPTILRSCCLCFNCTAIEDKDETST